MLSVIKAIIEIPVLNLYHTSRDTRRNFPIPEPLAVVCQLKELGCLASDIPIATFNSNIEERDEPAEIDDCVGHVVALVLALYPLVFSL